MKVGTFLKNSAFLAIATSMVVTALPAQAQERTWRENRAERSAPQQQQAQRPARAERAARPAPQAAPQAQVRAPARAPVAQAAPQAQVRAPARGPAPQVAQRGGEGRRDGGGRSETRSNGGREGGWQRQQPQAQAPVRQQPQQQTAQRPQRNGTYVSPDRNRTYRSEDRRDDDRRDGRYDRNDRDGRYDGRDGRYDRNDRDGRDGYRSGQRDDRQWDRRWRDDRRYDWNGWRSRNRTTFNIGVYYSPYRNYSYRRLGIGYSLNSLFYSSRYWINDPWQYRLPEVYGPYRWVRYYDDVLLVDIYSGEVVDVINDFFW